MPVIARSLVNYSQTISGQTIPAHGMRTYAGPTSALTSAETDKKVQLTTVADVGSLEPSVGTTYYNVPLTTETYAIPDDAETVLFKPAGTIAALTVTMPVNPYDGQKVTIASTQVVTSLSQTAAGKTIQAPLTAFTANGFGTWRYRLADTTWYRVG